MLLMDMLVQRRALFILYASFVLAISDLTTLENGHKDAAMPLMEIKVLFACALSESVTLKHILARAVDRIEPA